MSIWQAPQSKRVCFAGRTKNMMVVVVVVVGGGLMYSSACRGGDSQTVTYLLHQLPIQHHWETKSYEILLGRAFLH